MKKQGDPSHPEQGCFAQVMCLSKSSDLPTVPSPGPLLSNVNVICPAEPEDLAFTVAREKSEITCKGTRVGLLVGFPTVAMEARDGAMLHCMC